MKTKVKIDDIYKEKLGGIENPPPADSWDIILSRLPEKTKNKIAPLWYKLGGVAAAIALLVLLFNDFFQKPISSSPSISVEEKREIFNPDPTSVNFEKYMREAGSTLENIVTGYGSPIRKRQKENSFTNSGSTGTPVGERKNQTSTVVSSSPGKNQLPPVTEMAPLNELSVTSNLIKEHKENKTSGIPFSFEPILLHDAELTASRPIYVNTILVVREINGIIAIREEKEVNESVSKENRFSLTTSAGAVYLGKLGKGNLLSSQFNAMEDDGRITPSYGVYLAYQLSNKIKIRSGVSKVDFSYSTQNIDYRAVLNSQIVTSPITASAVGIEATVPGSLEQGFGFMEIPLELEYALIKRKMEINLIGGVSSFFLQKNDISFTAGNNSATLGEARSLNDLSFSANIGLGFNYHLSPLFQFNLEPIFKYQINTFDNSVDVNSYFLGINSGLRFKF